MHYSLIGLARSNTFISKILILPDMYKYNTILYNCKNSNILNIYEYYSTKLITTEITLMMVTLVNIRCRTFAVSY